MKSSKYYDAIAQGYEELHGEEQLKKINLIKNTMRGLGWVIQLKDTVLDVACGTGLSTRCWPGKKTGIDSAKKLLEKAKKAKDDCTYVLGAAEEMNFLDHHFDWVFSITALQNFDDLGKALSEIKRVGKNHFILSFLKKSAKKEEITKKIRQKFKIIKEIEEEKDIIIFGE